MHCLRPYRLTELQGLCARHTQHATLPPQLLGITLHLHTASYRAAVSHDWDPKRDDVLCLTMCCRPAFRIPTMKPVSHRAQQGPTVTGALPRIQQGERCGGCCILLLVVRVTAGKQSVRLVDADEYIRVRQVQRLRWLWYGYGAATRGYRVATVWVLSGYSVVKVWLLCGYCVATVQLRYGYGVVTVWLRWSYGMATVWLPGAVVWLPGAMVWLAGATRGYCVASVWLHCDYSVTTV